MTKLFDEEQKFSNSWIIGVVVGITFIPIYGVYQQIIMGESFGSKPMSDLNLISFLIFTLLLLGLFLILNLKTEITENEVRMKYFPVYRKTVKWSDVKKAEVIDYGFVGGWGIRFWSKYGTVYNVKGSTGLAIELKNGKKFLIGTQKETELKYVLQQINRSKPVS